MTKQKTRTTKIKSDPTWLIAISIGFISIYFNPSLADPFNSPKLWALIILGSWLLAYCIINPERKFASFSKSQKIYFSILFLFVMSLFISAIVSSERFTAFIGEQQRKLGFIFYLFMAVFMLASSMYFTVARVYKIFYASIFLSVLFIIYGLMQYFGKDFVEWNNPYNSIILTLGNPNFASALMSILAVLITSFVFIVNSKFKIPLALLVICLIMIIVQSNSRQGLVSFGLGFSVFLIIYLYINIKKIAIWFSIILIPFILLLIAGMLQIGPLTQLIYKASVSIRGYYWRAGLEMFKSNPLFGVGVDNYGEYFRTYREKQYPLTYGFTITSDNAHNVPIQLFATAGVFAGMLYLILIFLIITSTLRALKNSSNKDKLLVAGIFSAWVAFQAQSIISIDNVGLTIWGWVLGGILIGLGFGGSSEAKIIDNSNHIKRQPIDLILKRKILSFVFTFIGILFVVQLYQGEKYLYDLTRYVNYSTQNQSELFKLTLNKIDQARFVEPAYRFRIANLLFQIGQIDAANSRVNDLLKSQPNSYDFLFGYAQILAIKEDWNSIAVVREKISKVDPWNAENYLFMAQSYEKMGNRERAITLYKKILTFAGSKPVGQEARNSIEKLIAS